MTEPLYTKYRPKTFKEVIGQDAVVRSLQRCIEDRSGQTFLLHGPSGTGKTTLARIVAAAFGAKQSDIREIDAATFTGIDAMREITKTLAYRPVGEGSIKVYIIDECHRLSAPAWDSLLKSLEEPPPWVYWFLCTTDPGKLPVTIKTRAVTHALKPLIIADLEEILFSITDAEKIMEDDEGIKIVRHCAKQGEGSPRQAISNLEACLGAKNLKEAQGLLQSAVDVPEAIDLAKALIAGKPWSFILELLADLKGKELNPESVRHVIRGYTTAVILGGGPQDQIRLMAVLQAFSIPFSSSDQMSPLVLACGTLILGG